MPAAVDHQRVQATAELLLRQMLGRELRRRRLLFRDMRTHLAVHWSSNAGFIACMPFVCLYGRHVKDRLSGVCRLTADTFDGCVRTACPRKSFTYVRRDEISSG